METWPRLGLLQWDSSGPRSRRHVPRSLGLPAGGDPHGNAGWGSCHRAGRWGRQGHRAARSHPRKGQLSPREHTEQFWPVCLKKSKFWGFFLQLNCLRDRL